MQHVLILYHYNMTTPHLSPLLPLLSSSFRLLSCPSFCQYSPPFGSDSPAKDQNEIEHTKASSPFRSVPSRIPHVLFLKAWLVFPPAPACFAILYPTYGKYLRSTTSSSWSTLPKALLSVLELCATIYSSDARKFLYAWFPGISLSKMLCPVGTAHEWPVSRYWPTIFKKLNHMTESSHNLERCKWPTKPHTYSALGLRYLCLFLLSHPTNLKLLCGYVFRDHFVPILLINVIRGNPQERTLQLLDLLSFMIDFQGNWWH